jgi:outer membrane usher protein
MLIPHMQLTTLMTCMLAASAAYAQPSSEPREAGRSSRSTGFNTQFLQGSVPAADLADFLRGDGVLPHLYSLDVIVNRRSVGRHRVRFVRSEAQQKVIPCLNLSSLESFGVNVEKLLAAAAPSTVESAGSCLDLPALIPEYDYDYRPNQLQLALSFPQASMRTTTRRQTDPATWDEGATVGFSNYSANTRRDWRDGSASSASSYVGLRNGLNIGRWRIRNDSNVVSSTFGGTRFSSNRSYAQRDIDALHSQLTVGQLYTDSQVFDSVRIRGLSLRMDESMLPDNERGYAPVVRGIAESNATVEVRQNGYLLTSTPVSPGPFVIEDLYPSGSNGELEITIIEAGGRRRVTRQPFGALPMMVRPGALRYHAAAGFYDAARDTRNSPGVFMGTLAWGARDNFTAFGGLQASSGFQSVDLGAAINTFYGAMSADVTNSRSSANGHNETGQSVRFLYTKTFTRTETNFTLAGYRYSSAGYRTLQDHIEESNGNNVIAAFGGTRTRTSFNLSVYQRVSDTLGSVFVSANDQTYWNASGNRRTLRAGYNNTYQRIGYGLTVAHSSDMLASGLNEGAARRLGSDTRVMLTLSAPLGSGSRAPVGSAYLSGGSSREAASVSAGVTGMLPGDRDVSYSVYGNRDRSGQSGSASLSGRLPVAFVSASASQGADYGSASLNANGVAVVHAGGVNFGPSVGETFGLVHIADTHDVGIQGGGTTGGNGYGIVPFLAPYTRNMVGVDTRKTGADVEIEQTSQHVVPRRGAVPVVTFKGATGRRIQFELAGIDGTQLPLAATVEDSEGRPMGVTDARGRVMVFLQNESGKLRARWNQNMCDAEYRLPPRDAAKAFQRIKLTCPILSINRTQVSR